MPIGGGTFTVQNKVLPGAYINFVSIGTSATLGERGTATLPLELNWGEENKVFTVDAAEFNRTALKVFGYDPTAPELLLVREAFKRAKTLKLYRVNSGGTKASKSIGGITVTAKHGGTRGNAIRVSVQTNIDNALLFDVTTYLDTIVVDFQTVSNASELVGNDYVSFGTGTLATASATALEGGTNGTVNGTQYTNYLTAVEVEDFNVIGYPGDDETTKALFAAFVKRLRDDEGKKVVCVLYQYAGDYEGIINVKNGVVLADGTTIPGEKAVAWVTGASAGAEVNQSLTNTAYEGAVDVDIRYPRSQYEAAIRAGEFVFYAEGNRARVLSDINSLVTFGETKPPDMTSNRVIRVLDGWANDVARIFGQSYIGIVTNSDTGRSLFKADLVSLANRYQGIDAISDFVPEDIEIQQGNGKRDVAVNTRLKPNDAMEKLYMVVQVV